MNGGTAGVYLMLQAAVLALGVLSDYNDVNVLVAGLHPRQGLAVHHISIQVQTSAESQTDREGGKRDLKKTDRQ